MKFSRMSKFVHSGNNIPTNKEALMLKEPMGKVPYHFPGITVLVPKQLGDDIVAIDKGSLVHDHIPAETENFKLTRYITNIALVKKTDYEEGVITPVQTFDPPIEFRVAYNFHDVMKSNGDLQQLKLAYWDGSQWVLLSDQPHDYIILPPGTGQVAEARIWSWVGDPMVAWGT